MPKAYIINDSYGVLARDYYLKFPEEPMSASTMAQVEDPKLVDNPSLDTMLTALASGDKKAGATLIMVSHGNEQGLVLDLFHGHPKEATTINLQKLMGSDSRDDKAKFLSLRPDRVDHLITKMEAVRKIGFGHIAFRGCTIGQNLANLTTLRDFLGAKLVTGTTLYSTFGYGLTKYEKDKKKFDALVEKYSKIGRIYEGTARVIFATRPGSQPYTEIVFFYVESEAVLHEWLQIHMYAATTSATATAVKLRTPLHWMTYTPPVVPLDGVNKKTGGALTYFDVIRTSDDKP